MQNSEHRGVKSCVYCVVPTEILRQQIQLANVMEAVLVLNEMPIIEAYYLV